MVFFKNQIDALIMQPIQVHYHYLDMANMEESYVEL